MLTGYRVYIYIYIYMYIYVYWVVFFFDLVLFLEMFV